jgi:glycerol-3-phosphate acyltransferase PlsY
VQAALSIVIGYLLGSISFSYLYVKLAKGIDIRLHGSGNAGATNTLRVLGVGPAIAVLLLDAVKGIAAVLVGQQLGGENGWIPVLAGMAAVAGHNWPVYFQFKGGKGIATTVGVAATLCFLPTLYAGIIAIVCIALTRYVSLGSLILTGSLPFFLIGMSKPSELIIASLIMALFAFIRHRSNIVKLIRGKENKLGAKKDRTQTHATK